MIKKNVLTKKKRKDLIFVAILLAYPVLQFVVTWCFVNIGAIAMAFQTHSRGGEVTFTFDHFINVFKELFVNKEPNTLHIKGLNDNWIVLFNSLGYAVITICVSLPLSLLFSYFLQKNMPLANVFRVIFFLPNIIPVVALTMAFNKPLMESGYLYELMHAIGINFPANMYAKFPTSQTMVYLYCIWAGLGYNVVLMSGAIGRIPKEIFESAQLDGAGYFTEFTKITIPLIWPTVITLVVLGMTNVLTLYLQPMLLTQYSGTPQTMTGTLAWQIFDNAKGFPNDQSAASAKGLLFSVIWAPIVLLVRNKMSKMFSEVDF